MQTHSTLCKDKIPCFGHFSLYIYGHIPTQCKSHAMQLHFIMVFVMTDLRLDSQQLCHGEKVIDEHLVFVNKFTTIH